MKTTKNRKIRHGAVAALVSGVVALLLNWLVFPIVYLIFHDCGRFICEHAFEPSWTSVLITFVVILIPAELLALSGAFAEVADSVKTTPVPRRRQSSSHNRETDYYDEDMEGAPGYYGGEE